MLLAPFEIAPSTRHASFARIEGDFEGDHEGDDGTLLLRVAASRDLDAFALLCRRLTPRLLGFGRARGLPDPEGLVQDVLLTLWRRAHTYDPRRAAVHTWVFTIARNRSIDQLRKARRSSADPEDPAMLESRTNPTGSAVAGAAERGHQLLALRDALGELSAPHKEIVERVYLRGETLAEAAAALSIPTGTAKSRLRLALAALRRVPLHEERDRG